MAGLYDSKMISETSGGFMESFKEKLNEIRKLIDEDKFRKKVLLLCQQIEPRSFDDYSSSGSFRRLEKFESSTYSEVLKAIDLANNNKPVVMKIMRALTKGVIRKLPSVATKGCQAYSDILNELVVTQALSQLHDGVLLNGQANSLYKTHFFCCIHEIKVVSGNLERTLSRSKSEANKQELKTSSLAEQATQTKQQSNDTSSGTSFPSPSYTNEEQQETGERQINSNNNQEEEEQQQKQQEAQPQEANPAPGADDHKLIKEEELKNLSEDDRMLMEALPYEYVVTVMRHDGQPLWWMMTNKKLTAEQLTSVLVQVIVGLAIAEKVYLYEHRDLHVSNILIKKTSKSTIPFILDGNKFDIISHNIKATIIDATFSRLTHNGKIYYRDLTSTLRAYGCKKTPAKMSLQNRSYRQMVHITQNNWEDFRPKTNLIWLTYLSETLMKSEILKNNSKLLNEVKKIRDYTLKANNTLELLSYFPFSKEKLSKGPEVQK